MRNLCLTLAAGLTALSTAALPSRADEGVLPGAGTAYLPAVEAIYRPSVDEAPTVEPVRLICTHFWNGRWHRRQICYWTPRHRHHYGYYRHYGRHYGFHPGRHRHWY